LTVTTARAAAVHARRTALASPRSPRHRAHGPKVRLIAAARGRWARLGNLKIMARDERSVTPQSEDFSAWYNDVVFRAELVNR